MADFTTLLAGESLADVAETWDAGINDKAQETADHLRSGKFENLVTKAHKVSEQKAEHAAKKALNGGKGFLCVTGQGDGRDAGTISLEKDLSRLERIQGCMREKERNQAEAVLELKRKDDVLLKDARVVVDSLANNSAYAANLTDPDELKMCPEGEEDEIDRLRKARLAQLRREKMMTDKWRGMGHGKLSLIPGEREFFKEVAGHERSVCVIHRAGDPICNVESGKGFMSCLAKIAETHLETGIFHMHEENARFMLSMLDVPDGGLPILYILRHGEVICRIGRQILLDENLCGPSGNDPKNLERLLKSRDAFGEGYKKNAAKDDSSSDEESENEEQEYGRRKRLDFQKMY